MIIVTYPKGLTLKELLKETIELNLCQSTRDLVEKKINVSCSTVHEYTKQIEITGQEGI